MKNRVRVLCIAAAVAAVLLTVLRCITLPMVVAKIENDLSTGLLIATVTVLVALLVLGWSNDPVKTIAGKPLWAVVAGALLTGTDMVVSSLWALVGWLTARTMPFPYKAIPTQTDEFLLYALVVTGLLGGAFFLLLGVTWGIKRRSVFGKFRVLALAPVLWVWVRIVRFELSYVSSLSLHRSVYELLMLTFETVFFLWLARALSGVEEKPSRLFAGVALCTAVLTAIACVTRMGMWVMQNEVAFEACALTTAADLGVCVLAFAVAVSHAAPQAELPEEEEPEEPLSVAEQVMLELAQPEDPYDGDGEGELLRVDTLIAERESEAE